MNEYERFVSTKLVRYVPVGFNVDRLDTHDALFDFQRDLVTWALRRGRCAIFASTGLGKSRMQMSWAHHVSKHTGKPVIVLAPLSVARQTVREAEAIGLSATLCRSGDDVRDGINVTNYDRIHLFDMSRFAGVVADESSIIKHHTSKTLALLLEAFDATPYRLCCTATPAPNDYVELGTHAQFLGICSQTEMLAEYFEHDGGETQKWALKGHAKHPFWRFVSSWGALVRSPEDLGYDGSAYVLPPLTVHHHTIEASQEATFASGLLFAAPAATLMDRRAARKGSIGDRVQRCADLVNECRDAFVVWCDLNAESAALTQAIPDAVEITGSMDADEKERRMDMFLDGKARVLISKSAICGFGVNLQHCHRMAFVGVTDSWEAYHQSMKRIHRFGQKHACDVHVFASELEGAVVANLARKERDALAMAEELAREVSESVRESVRGTTRTTASYKPTMKMTIPPWIVSEGP